MCQKPGVLSTHTSATTVVTSDEPLSQRAQLPLPLLLLLIQSNHGATCWQLLLLLMGQFAGSRCCR
jgi:hypothetical protein